MLSRYCIDKIVPKFVELKTNKSFQMKIKLLPILSLLLLTTLITTSCLSSNDQKFEFSSDDTIHSLSIDTIYGRETFFSIDQLNNYIFNKDSLPVGADTIINKITFKNIITTNAWVYHADTLFNYLNDSVDLRSPFELTVKSMDGEHERTYQLDVRVHRQDPDSLTWKKTSPSFASDINEESSFIGNIGNKVFIYSEKGKAYTSLSPSGSNWNEITPNGLPSELVVNRLLSENGRLFIHVNKEIYESENGVDWNRSSLSTKEIDHLLAITPTRVMATTTKEGKEYFITASLKDSQWVVGQEVPANFPKRNYSHIFYTRNKTAMLMGTPTDGGQTYAWMTESGKNWVEQKSKYEENNCPYYEQPHLIFYADIIFAFGGDYSDIYFSQNGIDWAKSKQKILLPKEFKNRKECSLSIDDNNYIWMSWKAAPKHKNEVWRGRLNKLGFVQ